MTTRRRLIPAGAGVLLVFAVLGIATLIPLWRAAGWPTNHDNAFGLRTHIYARHFAERDLLPIWSSADADGFGSPMPLMYHRLFFMVAGLLALAGTSLKTADATTLWLFLIAGGLGIYRTARALGCSRLAAAIGGCSLITANYTVTNWLVRGALAEFSGAMITAWALFFFLRSLQTGRLQAGLGVALGLLWLAHSVLAFYLVLLMAATGLVLAAAGAAPWSLLQPRTAIRPIAWFLLMVVPYLAAMAVLSPGYDFSRILLPYRPQNEFRPLFDYFWERTWQFGRTASGLTVQLDHSILTMLMVSLGLLMAGRLGVRVEPPRRPLRPVLPFLLLAGFALWLQTPASARVYEWLPGAAYLQFPWRLMALITPCLIVAAVFLADAVLPPDTRLFGLGCAAAWMIVGSGAFAPLRDPRIALDPPQLAGVSFSSPYREYEPRTAPALAEIRSKVAARWAEAGCFYERVGGSEETTVVMFLTACGRAVMLPLPLYASALHQVLTPDGRRQPCAAVPEFSNLCGVVIPNVGTTVSVELPRITELGGWTWRRIRHMLSRPIRPVTDAVAPQDKL